ncbi:hypothetical protein [Rhodanobacter soli]|uniref:hypothetical protein n=1 Tax=Rhodanobacter soli TaxID=590609 RepID=UPI0031D3A831
MHDLGGAVAVMPADATAFVHRDAPFFIDTMGHAQAAEKFTEVREWARGLRSSLAPWARDGVQANFAGETSDWHVRTHDAATRARLENLRRKYDPTGLLLPARSD